MAPAAGIVTGAQLHFRSHHAGHSRQKTLTLAISFPDSSNLKSKREESRVVADKYLNRWGVNRA